MGWWHNDYGLDDTELGGKLPTGTMFARVYPYLKPHRAAFLFAFCCSLLAVAMTLGQPLLLKRIIDVNVPGGDLRGLFYSSLGYLGLMVGSGLTNMVGTILLGRAGILAVNSIKRDLFSHFLDLGAIRRDFFFNLGYNFVAHLSSKPSARWYQVPHNNVFFQSA